MQAIILAAGFGTRLRPYTSYRPKPLFPILGQPLLFRLIEQLRAIGCRSVVVNCHHLAEQIAAAVATFPEVQLQIEPEILGTGGSLRLALAQLADEPLLVMNGDIYHDVDLLKLYQAHGENSQGVTMAMHDYTRFNTVSVQDGLVRGFSEDSTLTKMAFTGTQVVEPWVIEQIPESGFFHIIDLYKELAAHSQVGICDVTGSVWRDIGSPQDYLDLHRELLAQYPDSWLIDEEAAIAAEIDCRGWGYIGRGAQVGAGTILENVVVWDGAVIPENTKITNSIVTDNE